MFFGIFASSALWGLLIFAIMLDMPDLAPKTPKFHEQIKAEHSALKLLESPDGKRYYLFFEDGKEVKIQKQ